LESINNGFIFIEESGSGIIANSQDDFFIVSYLYCNDPSSLRLVMQRHLAKLHNRVKYPYHFQELKFFPKWNILKNNGYSLKDINFYKYLLPSVRLQTLDLIRLNCNGIFIAVFDKKTVRKPEWTSEKIGNFVIGQTLINDVIPSLPSSLPPSICFDKGRLAAKNMTRFYNYLTNKDGYYEYKKYKRYNGNVSDFSELNSLLEPCIWAADMVAGAFYCKYQKNDSSYSKWLNDKLLSRGIRKSWDNK
jgi:hypothetical protein